MIKKYVYGEPFETEALTETLETAEGKPGYSVVHLGRSQFSSVLKR